MVFHKSYYDAIKLLPEDKRLEAYDALMGYEFDGEEPEDISTEAEMVFTIIKPLLDAAQEKREHGKKGGRPKKETAGSKEENHRFSKNKTIGSKNQKASEVKGSEVKGSEVKGSEVKQDAPARVAWDADPDVDDAIEEFIKHRKVLRKPMSDHAVELFVQKLNGMADSSRAKIQLINTAIEHGWQTVYEPKEEKKKASGLPDWGSI